MFNPSCGNNKEQLVFWIKAYQGDLDIPLVYVVQKPTPPSNDVDETECLLYEAKYSGPG